METKDLYIRKIKANTDDPEATELLKMMDYYNVTNLQELTLLEVKEYYMHIMRGNTN